ncbi:MAG: hypothetical protein WBN95_05705 [Gammaproteobacteria bacterium]
MNGGVIMGEVAYDLKQQAAHNTEILIHIDETLEEQRRNELVDALEATAGIHTAEFCPLRYHLVLVQYDRDNLRSQDVLNKVKEQDVNAQLIGPV